MVSSILGIAGFLLVVGICNDTATIPQILLFGTIGVIMMLISVACHFRNHEKEVNHFKMRFISKYGNKDRIIHAYTYAGRAKAIRDLEKESYIFYEEVEILNEKEARI